MADDRLDVLYRHILERFPDAVLDKEARTVTVDGMKGRLSPRLIGMSAVLKGESRLRAKPRGYAKYKDIVAALTRHEKDTEDRLRAVAKGELVGYAVKRADLRKAIIEVYGRPGRRGRPSKNKSTR